MVVSFKQFRDRYPTATMVSDLLMLRDDQFVVKVTIQIPDVGAVTGMAADTHLEAAEDRARQRALAGLGIEETAKTADRPILPGVSLPMTVPVANEATAQQESVNSTVGLPAPLPLPEAELVEVEGPTSSAFANASSKAHVKGPASLAPENASLKAEFKEPTSLAPENASPKVVAQRTEESVTVTTTTPVKDTTPQKITAKSPEVLPIKEPDALPTKEPDFVVPEMLPSPVNLSDVIAQTDVELRRLGWSVADGREYLESTYGKRSRHDLTDEELLAFLLHLESLSHSDDSA